ncbi:MAG: SIMPL domain-containing protein [Actinomycetota bacterium]|nr:SIMPL domain-containing protein [Actinomycetota bacterium]
MHVHTRQRSDRAPGVEGDPEAVVDHGHGARQPGEALRLAADALTALVRLLERRGVAGDDRHTAHVSVNAVFDHQRQVVSHHEASYQRRVKVADVATAGALLDETSADAHLAGVLRVHAIGFSFADPEPLLAAARAEAVASARRRAQELAAAARVALGPSRGV